MSYGQLKAKEAELMAEVEALVKKAETSDSEEDDAYQQETGYSIPEDLQYQARTVRENPEGQKST